MLDLHCHILPGVDDGAPDVEAALEMARSLVGAGYTHVAASPHRGGGPGGDVAPDVATAAREELSARLDAEGIALSLLPNAEHYVTPELLSAAQRGDVTPIGGESRWLLLELPWQPVSNAEDIIFRFQTAGFKILMAHPERYAYLDVDTLGRLVERGVKMQLELGSFVGLYGKRIHIKAMNMVDGALAHVVGTDLHHAREADVWIPEAFRILSGRYGKSVLHAAVDANPRALVADAAADAVAPFTEAR